MRNASLPITLLPATPEPPYHGRSRGASFVASNIGPSEQIVPVLLDGRGAKDIPRQRNFFVVYRK